MPIIRASLTAWTTRHRLHAEAIAVSALAIIVFAGLGVRARRASLPARADVARFGVASLEISRFRAAFVTALPEQEMRLGQLADSLGIAVSREERVGLAQQVAAAAESAGLTGVRVRFAAQDSAAPPARPELMGASARVADYTLSVEGAGGLGAVLSLLDHLPPSVALQRIVAARAGGETRHRLVLAVFELEREPAPASGGSH